MTKTLIDEYGDTGIIQPDDTPLPLQTKPVRHRDWMFGNELGNISIEPKGRPPAGSWWVGVPRGDQWDAVVEKETKRMNPASSVPPMPQGGVWKSA